MNGMCIILIGPMGVGKSTAAAALAKRLGIPHIDFDELRWDYFKRMPDYNPNAGKDMGRDDFFAYIKPFEVRLVETILAEYECGIFDFGAGFSVYDDPALFNRVKDALEPYPNVIHLRYSDDADECGQVLLARNDLTVEEAASYRAMNYAFIKSPCNGLLAKRTVDTKGLDPGQVADAIVAGLV